MGNPSKKEETPSSDQSTKELLCQSCKRMVFDETKKSVKLVMWHRKNLFRDQRKYAENKLGRLTQTLCDDYSTLLGKYIQDSEVDIRTERSYLLFKGKV